MRLLGVTNVAVVTICITSHVATYTAEDNSFIPAATYYCFLVVFKGKLSFNQ